MIEITETGVVMTPHDFYNLHPTVAFAQPLTDEALAPYGAKLAEVAQPEQPAQWPRFEGNDKLDLFTMDEQLAVVTATMTDPVVKLLYDRLLGARYWTYEDPETERGLALLEAKELITAERKAQIVQQMLPPNWPISSQ